MQPTSDQRAVLLGAAFLVGSELMFASMAAVIKSVSVELPTAVIVCFRNLFGLAALMPLVLRHHPRRLATRVLHLHVLRASAGLSAMYCFFFAIAHLPLTEATLLKLSSPLFIPLVALFWLREEIPAAAVWAVVLGFAGVVLVLRPGAEGFQLAGLVGLLGGALAALAKVTVRRLSRTEPTTRIVFYFACIATSVSAVPLIWSWETPEARDWLLLGLLGMFATAGQLMLTRAFGLAPAARVGPLTYSSVVFASAYGWLLWGEVPGMAAITGGLLIVLAGILAVSYSRHRRVALQESRRLD
jgi:drug/metabolite transporter (DMT)-like permease